MLNPVVIGDCTLYLGDCRDILPTLPKVDVVILTDPPYGISHPTDYAARGRGRLAPCTNYPPVYDDDKSFDPAHLLRWPAVLFGANHYADKLPPSSGWIVWDKMRPELLDQSTAELAWSNCIKGVRVFRHLWNGMIRASEKDPLFHPTQKPVALMQWILGLPWIPVGTICDPYIGAGSTGVACVNLGRKFIGIEIEPRYFEIACRRIEAATKQEKLPFGSPAPPEQSRLDLRLGKYGKEKGE